jgi:signal transduction histidine kinase
MIRNPIRYMQMFFLMYAAVCGAAGLALTSWPGIIATFRPDAPWLEHSLVRMIGGTLMLAASGFAALRIVREPAVLRKAMFCVAAGHCSLTVVMLTQTYAVWNGAMAKNITGVLVFAGIGIISAIYAVNAPGQRSGELIGLFSGVTPGRSIDDLRSSYEEQIRQAAGQEERNRLARDLHDSIKQQIFAIQTSAAAAQVRFDSDPAGARAALEAVRGSAREATTEMEAMLDQLRAAPLETTGLVEALKKHAEALGYRTGAKVLVNIGSLPPNEVLPPGLPQAIFRIAQESLANVAKHARATEVNVTLEAVGTEMRIEIRDNGTGFDMMKAGKGMGLGNIRARAAEFNGTVEIDSRPGTGTIVLVNIPFVGPSEVDPAYLWTMLALSGINIVIWSGLIWRKKEESVLVVVWAALGFAAAYRLYALYARRRRESAKGARD